MAKIVKIELNNYRSYFDRYTIEIPEGKNLLIYGENGSGKSSLYDALKQFYIASDATRQAKLSRHLSVPELYEAEEGHTLQSEVYVKVTYIANNGDPIEKTFGVPNGDVEGDQTIKSFSQQSIFLSYRELLRTHLMGDLYNSYEFQTKFADLIITQILSYKTNTGTNQSYQKNWNDLYVKGKGSRPNRAEKEAILTNFDLGFKKDIIEINLHLNQILKYFEPNLTIELKAEDSYIEYDGQNYPVFQVSLKGKFYEMVLNENDETHLTILNEARLSALAISIFLAGIITANQQNIPQKFLFLDDIFIGLDMSNRKPLLKILTEYKIPTYEDVVDPISGELKTVARKDANQNVILEPLPFFKRYQIFLTTYDKHWFEIAKNFLPDANWQSIEMYSHFDEENEIEVPLIQNSLDYYQRATFYFRKNKEQKDYPAAANYLRKECEQQLKRILYGNYSFKNGEKGQTILREELDDLRQGFEKLLQDLGFTTTLFAEFSNIAKATLNPLSHDNLQKPIYKRELEDAFKLIDNLRLVSKEVAFEKNIDLVVTTVNGAITRVTNLKLADEVLLYQIEGVKKLTPILLKPINYNEGTAPTNLNHLPICKVEKAYDMIHKSVFNTNNASNGIDAYPAFILSDNSNLRTTVNNKLAH